MTERTFTAMGTDVRIVVEDRSRPGGPSDEVVLDEARASVDAVDRTLSRFRPESELSRLNRDPRTIVPCSPLLRDAVRAALWAARRSGGLVDPTLAGALRDAGYARDRADAVPADLRAALAAAPAPRAARPDPTARWRRVGFLGGAIVRPPGVALETGGSTKGLVADRLAERLRAYGRVAVDCGGDIRVGGARVAAAPFALEVRHPVTGASLAGLELAAGAVATSGIDVNLWRRADGSFAHHLLDPATGAPAWTGVVGATAFAPTALEAEVLAKMALLRGPAGAREVLRRHGGIAFGADGAVEAVGLPAPWPAGRLAA